jgi:hypothetical protein
VVGNPGVKPGQIKHLVFSNIIARGENGMIIFGSKESIIEDLVFDHVRFELTDSKLNDVAGGNVDLRGAAIEKSLFSRDIPGLLAQYVKDVSITDFQLKWTKTRMPYFSHGMELDHFDNVKISAFSGAASPVNKSAYRVFATEGKRLIIDDKSGVMVK